MNDKNIKLEHVFYEIWMYLATYHGMIDGVEKLYKENVMVHNALWESHLIHLRAMLYFFENQQGDKDSRNIYVEDIVTNAKQYTFIGNNVYMKNDISQTLAHLSCKRSQMNKGNLGKDAYDKFVVIEPIIFHFISDIEKNIKDELRDDLYQNMETVKKIVEELQKDIQ